MPQKIQKVSNFNTPIQDPNVDLNTYKNFNNNICITEFNNCEGIDFLEQSRKTIPSTTKNLPFETSK